MRHQLRMFSLLIGSLLTLTACAQPASVGIPTPNQATRDVQQLALTATALQSASTPLPSAPTVEQQVPSETPAQVAPTSAPATTTPEQPTQEPTAKPTSVPSTNYTGSCNRLITYIVKPGDNLFRIALRYRTTAAAIARRNGIPNTRVIHVGQRLRILTCAR